MNNTDVPSETATNDKVEIQLLLQQILSRNTIVCDYSLKYFKVKPLLLPSKL